jgi:hypothetical protein
MGKLVHHLHRAENPAAKPLVKPRADLLLVAVKKVL